MSLHKYGHAVGDARTRAAGSLVGKVAAMKQLEQEK